MQKSPSKGKLLSIGIYAIAFLVISVLLVIYFGAPNPEQFQNTQFKFHSYCSVYYQLDHYLKETTYLSQIFGLISQSTLLNKYLKTSYVVRVYDATFTNATGFNTYNLQYCGFLREWDGSCENAKYLCTIPGAYFQTEEDTPISVYWVNRIGDIDITLNYTNLDTCHASETSGNVHCTINQKDPSGCDELTYQDPTSTFHHPFVISPKNSIFSTHVHGMEIRPTFDGNPLSWIGNRGQKGIGYFSYEMNYYDKPNPELSAAMKLIDKWLDLGRVTPSYFKLNVYPNKQQPGTLWYHDHGMRSTKFNVASGLFGFYIIRNDVFESSLPKGEYEKMIILYNPIQNVNNNNNTIQVEATNNDFKVNNQYRVRILNGQFSSSYSNIQIKSSTKTFDFTVIGTDSAVRRTETAPLNSVGLGPAERVDLLIQFNSVDFPSLPTDVKIYLNDRSNTTISLRIVADPAKKTAPTKRSIRDTNVPFYNYTEFTDQEIAVKRMRPLTHYGPFGINGHSKFHKGASENPRIGTVEDWFFINTMSFGHPIHVHLIQYQVIGSYKLKTFTYGPDNSSRLFYEIDFFMYHNLSCNGALYKSFRETFVNGTPTLADYQAVAVWISSLDEASGDQCFLNFANEGQVDSERVSGINILKKNSQANPIFNVEGCDDSYKYICQNVSETIPEYKRGYKETTMVQGFDLTVVRIRWARSDMSNAQFRSLQDDPNAQFFKLPKEHLIEFPGFVYHCHILSHEDNEMMRPIMMQPHSSSSENWGQIYPGENTDNCPVNSDLRRVR